MTPQMLQVLTNIQKALKRDLDVLGHLVDQKKEEYVKITSMIYHISDNLEAMASEEFEKIVINCDPPDVDEEGRLI